MDDELRAFFEMEGLMRYQVVGDETGRIDEQERPPLVALGPGDDDFVVAPDPREMRYLVKPLSEMTLDDYNTFMFRWFEAAVQHGAVRCAHCGKLILPGDDLPDPDTWDAIFVEKELTGWMLVHFDCKRWLAKKLKGVGPFDVVPGRAPVYDLSEVAQLDVEMTPDGGEHN